MVRERLRFLSLINLAGDALLLVFSFIAAYYSIWHHIMPNAEIFLIKVAIALLLCWGVTSFTLRLYSHDRDESSAELLLKHFLTLLVSAVLLSLMVYSVIEFSLTRILFIYGYFLFAVLDTFFRLCVLFMIRRR
jgi:CDP-diglyceride synthetase